MKESFTVNSFCVILDRTGTKNFASFYVGVPITERIGLNGGNSFIPNVPKRNAFVKLPFLGSTSF